MPSPPLLDSDRVKARAVELGFDLCGIAAAGGADELSRLGEWLARGFGGRMTYLNRSARVRADIRRWLPSARSIVAVASLYNTDHPHHVELADPARARIARYAWGADYHDEMGRRLEALAQWMRETAGPGFQARWCVDDGPVQEKVWAARAGLGWIGKNTCVINREAGSWILLGILACSADLEPDPAALDECGTCRQCLDACPTRALVEPYLLDARRCLSYLTIEIRGSIPADERRGMGAHVFGCDICQDVCPYNAVAPIAADPCWQPRPALRNASLASLWALSDEGLAAAIEGTALRRAGVTGLRRNLAVALGNAGALQKKGTGPFSTPGGPETGPVPLSGGDDDRPSLADPMVAAHIAWARSEAR